ncbi:hypothetical protein [Brevibacillus brevis]|uniref:hypothetical protein n=1 Tax=Brevibacillus brevis TaxID=1393 RepID=UPI00165D60F9|nr:hypothetical protein [Brevibacillus brevis]
MNKRNQHAITPKYFRNHADYKSAFSVAVDELIDGIRAGVPALTNRTSRNREVDALITEYFESVGELPDAFDLERLTNAILHEELTDDDEHKVSRHEYPILSDIQLARRREGKHQRGQGGMGAETSEKMAEEIGSDGASYRKPTRRKRSDREMMFVDKNAKIRNEKRRIQYEKDTKPGEVVRYFIEK